MKTIKHPRLARAALALGAALLTSVAATAAVVDVHFVQPDRFTDIGFERLDRERALQAIEQHLTRLGTRLPDGARLRVDVLDVDLAGRLEPWPTRQVRVLGGQADWPRMTLRWRLDPSSGGDALASGEERLADLGYLSRTAPLRSQSAYAPDLRLIDDWFDRRLAAHAAVR